VADLEGMYGHFTIASSKFPSEICIFNGVTNGQCSMRLPLRTTSSSLVRGPAISRR
jgi:hypothetical protein